jgi:hypothetical protein
MVLFWEFKPCVLLPPHTLGPHFQNGLILNPYPKHDIAPNLKEHAYKSLHLLCLITTHLNLWSNMRLVLYNGVKFTQMGDNIRNIRGWTQLPPCPQPFIL